MIKVYILSLMGMVMLYTLRAGYSYAKPYIQKQYQFSILFLSLVDAVQFLGLALAFLFKYFLFDQHFTVTNFTKTGIIMSISYFLMPLMASFGNFS